MCQPRKHLARIFFPAHCMCVNFFLDNSLVQEIFSYAHALAGYFFSKSPNPPPPQKLNGWPLSALVYKPESLSFLEGFDKLVVSLTERNFTNLLFNAFHTAELGPVVRIRVRKC